MKYEHQLKSVPDDELLRRLSELLQKSRHIESELVAEISPKPDVPTTMHKLPARRDKNSNRSESARGPVGDGVSPTPISTPAITQPLSPAR